MANLGDNPELEEKLYCDDCRGGAHGQVLVYDHVEVGRLLEAEELKLGERCVRCGSERGDFKEAQDRRREQEAREEAKVEAKVEAKEAKAEESHRRHG